MKLKRKLILPLVCMLGSALVACGPTSSPSEVPTNPTTEPSVEPSLEPTTEPIIEPTIDPTEEPTTSTSKDPTTSISSTVVEPSVSEDPTVDPSTNPSTPDTPNGELTLEQFNEKYTMNDFFSHVNKVKTEIHMDKKELYQLSQDYDAYPHHSSPIYRICDLTIHINDDYVRLNKVGIRLKGNTSRRKFVNENGEVYTTVHFKFDFNELIDYVDYTPEEEAHIDERKFLDLKKLDVKWNKNYDTSHIKEYIASRLYKEYDVKSQAMGFSHILINGKNMGLYYTYETIDKQFTKRHYSKAENGGDLYKACYTAAGPANLTYGKVGENIGEEDEDANGKNGFFPSYDIKTNKDETDHSQLLNLIKVLNNSSTKIADINSVVDLNQFIKYEAVSYVLGDPDDFRNNWNNTFIYFNKETGLAEFLPYDKDRMFGTQCDWNPTGNGMTTVNPQSNWAQGANSEQNNQLYRKILSRPIEGADKYVNTYMNLIKEIFDSSSVLASFDEVYETVKDLYSDIVVAKDIPSIEFKTTDNTNLTFEKYITAKKAHFESKFTEFASCLE